ncbi:putative cobalamin synthesis protein CobW [Bradyrhizobium oligotrophicum S58]|uniref:Putative cobalamin synthesis protein CobW n=1 Tax=Bradyrhizobium oligotrophicum S58 TaxID=1245469 RepID=M4ZNH9_9BRAD|nr:GTP-binding protein [Bradyrhizobium oligotrophicum]BAM87780.1 putative cobalamin synthesis protein CobW [Bradyrhizobium oligotrophicum S58]
MSAVIIDFFVLTGFLGSGKTSLLRDVLGAETASDTAVIVNEAGEVGLDGVLLRESGDDLPMAMLSNGCVCCQVGSDLAFTIDRLIMTPRPAGLPPLRRIILETSGLSMPGPVLRQLATLAEHRMRVAVIATYDLTRGLAVAEFEEAAAQWAAAHRIVATKADLVPDTLIEAPVSIAQLNPVAEAIATVDRTAAVSAAFAPLAASLPSREVALERRAAHPRLALCLVRPRGEIAYADLAGWLDNVAGALGERLLRIKGLVRVHEAPRPLLVESVGTMFSPPRQLTAEKPPAPFLVVIARDIDRAELEQVAPTGLFTFSWRASESGVAPRGIRAEWVT